MNQIHPLSHFQSLRGIAKNKNCCYPYTDGKKKKKKKL